MVSTQASGTAAGPSSPFTTTATTMPTPSTDVVGSQQVKSTVAPLRGTLVGTVSTLGGLSLTGQWFFYTSFVGKKDSFIVHS